MIANLIRAFRLPFIGASAIPFIFGSLLYAGEFYPARFILGLVAALSLHLSANLINDYADSKSGADWQDKKFYGLFGGSKLIQQGVFSESFYLLWAIFFMLFSFACVGILSLMLGSGMIIVFYLAILFLSWLYSLPPLAFSYRMLGEFIIFLLFGPALVSGAYFIQANVLPNWQGFLLSLPFGFFTAAVLFSNEIPDFASDKAARKNTWVNLSGPKRAFFIYYLLLFLAFFSIAVNIILGNLNPSSTLAFFLIPLALKAGRIIRAHYDDKEKLTRSSKYVISIQFFCGLILIVSLFI